MTYIEFFEEVAAENISVCLTHIPDRVIYIGSRSKVMKKHIEWYSKVFADRGHCIEFSYRTIFDNNLDDAVELLTELIETYDDCVFDITGGSEILLLALGVVYERNSDRNIRIHKHNIRNNVLYDCDKDGVTVYRDIPELSVRDNVRIYGGEVVYGSIDELQTYNWELSPDFIDDIEAIWSMCREDVRLWNILVGALALFVTTLDGDGVPTAESTIKQNEINLHLAKFNLSRSVFKEFTDRLCDGNLIRYTEDADGIKIEYKNKQIKRCLEKSGMALEMKIYITIKMMTDKTGSAIYNDAENGVVIDWDGVIHEDEEAGVCDTENEVDVLVMHNIVPIFISCKNGIITVDELYKLNTVARRFGGKYAKQVLVATSISRMGEGAMYLRQRAEDMNIKLIENIQALTDEELRGKLSHLWCN